MTDEKLTPKKARRTGEWRESFIAALRDSGNVRLACSMAGVSRAMAYKEKEKGNGFAAQWQDAMQDAVEMLEGIARKRAMESSDTLIIFLLKAHKPEMYRETIRQEHTGADGAPLLVRMDR